MIFGARAAGRAPFPPLSRDTTQKEVSALGFHLPEGLQKAHPTRPPAAGIARCPTRSGAGAGGAGAGLGDPAGQRRAGGAAPRGSARVWPLAAVFTEMSVRRMAAERWAEGPPSDLGEARWAPPTRSGRPGGDPPAGPGLFVFRRSQSCISLFLLAPTSQRQPCNSEPSHPTRLFASQDAAFRVPQTEGRESSSHLFGEGGAGERPSPRNLCSALCQTHPLRFGSTVPSALAVLRGPSSGAVCAFCTFFVLAFVFVFLFLLP